jgi:hypothetical protein
MADIVTSRLFVDGEKNITAAKMNDIVASSVIQPAFYSAKSTASTVAPTDNLLILTAAGGTYAKAPFQTVIDSVNASLNTNAAIWNVRLRSFQALNNNTFEVDQRNVGNTVAAAGGLIIDRWAIGKTGVSVISAGQNSVAAGINLQGTNFALTRSFFRVTLTTQDASLAAGDFLTIYQNVEGIRWRELQNDVHSLQILVRSSVASLSIGVALADPTGAHSLTNILTLGAANTWVLFSLPNLPVWPAGSFVNTPGNPGYQFKICLFAGTTYTSPANGTWQNGNFSGAVGQSNFGASLVNSTFDIAYVSHEPGSLCSNPPMDCPFTQNYDDCLRYFQKSYPYAVMPGTANSVGIVNYWTSAGATAAALVPIRFPKVMAKTPTVVGYSNNTGAINTVRNATAGADVTISSSNTPGDAGFNGFNLSTTVAASSNLQLHYTADTGW